MNIQTEQLENHRVRFTVQIEADRFERAKQKVARKIAQQVRIPGFRRGKVPYRILVQNGLEPAILDETIEELSQAIYRETLEQSEIDPYGPGAFEDFNLEESPVFIYSVSLQPTVKVGDYRAIRKDFIEPEVTDEEVEESLKQLQHAQADIEESEEPVALGNRVTLDIHSTFADDAPEPVEASEASEGDEDEDEDEEMSQPQKGDHFIHQHDATVYLDPDEEVVLPGFKEQLVGANVDDDLSFELVIPEGHAYYPELAGRHIQFKISVATIETMTIPALDDEFVVSLAEEDDEDAPKTVEALREKMRQDIRKEKIQTLLETYSFQVLDDIVAISEIAYPEEMLQEQIDSMIEDFERQLQQSHMDLETYYKVTGSTRENVAAQYREPAGKAIRRSLTMREVIIAEHLRVTDAMIDERIDRLVTRFGAQGEAFRSVFDTPEMRMDMLNDILQKQVMERIAAIGRGEEIPEPTAEAEGVAEVIEAEEVEEVTGEPVEDETVSDGLEDQSDAPDAEETGDEA